MGHLWLIGMMGTGKSTVAPIVADRLQIPVVDVDALIVEQNNRTVHEIFAEGESVFRALESAAITALAVRGDSVIATGGGVVLDPENVETMRASGTTILLVATLEAISSRLNGNSDRPLGSQGDSLAAVYRARREIYLDSADVTVDTTHLDASGAAEEVLECVAM